MSNYVPKQNSPTSHETRHLPPGTLKLAGTIEIKLISKTLEQVESVNGSDQIDKAARTYTVICDATLTYNSEILLESEDELIKIYFWEEIAWVEIPNQVGNDVLGWE